MVDQAVSSRGKSKRSAPARTSLATISPAPGIRRLLESSLYVADLTASRAFYERIIGLSAMFADARMCAMAIPGRGVLLLFRKGASVTASPAPGGGSIPPHDGQGSLHLAFAVSEPAIALWEAHLARNGVAVESRVRWPSGAVSLYFRDPDGHSLEVAGPGLWPNDVVRKAARL